MLMGFACLKKLQPLQKVIKKTIFFFVNERMKKKLKLPKVKIHKNVYKQMVCLR